MKKYFYLSLALILAVLGCSKKYHNPEPSENYMVLNEIQYVEEYWINHAQRRRDRSYVITK